ncbi:FAD-linked oxidase C-terminal domain-containing protein [Vulcanisaeta sp. JCM 16159]|nr:FAD-linked oxidase C-terminal domain-containing protein [Vulcanisaeta sp. JCM 16159]
MKRDFAKIEMGNQWKLLRSIKGLLDENNIMNRGKLVW